MSADFGPPGHRFSNHTRLRSGQCLMGWTSLYHQNGRAVCVRLTVHPLTFSTLIQSLVSAITSKVLCQPSHPKSCVSHHIQSFGSAITSRVLGQPFHPLTLSMLIQSLVSVITSRVLCQPTTSSLGSALSTSHT